MKILKENKKGITLIALVITIIVLLILAGISIGAITGDNGIINQAHNAKDDTQKAQWEEQIDVAIIDAESKHRNPTMANVIEELKNKHVIDDASQVNEQTGAIETNEPKYTIEGKLDDYIKGITADVIANAEDKSEFYGAIVNNYTCENSAGVNNWKIFYADENNIYIIADDYINVAYCPGSKNYEIYDNGNGYKLSMNNVIKDYQGSQDITDERIKALNNDYFNVKGYSSTNNNMKAVAYMLDTDVWSVFAGDKAEYAIGGPTVEMFLNSYDEKYGTNYVSEATSNIGYQFRSNSGYTYFLELSVPDDELYTISSMDKADYMLLASPANTSNVNCLIDMSFGGNFIYDSYMAKYVGFRPVVCLKSDVILKKDADGSYSIK